MAFTAADGAEPPLGVINEEVPGDNSTDEWAPKSTPKHPKDQYIRKRMIIVGSHYCDRRVLEHLQPGTYLELQRGRIIPMIRTQSH